MSLSSIFVIPVVMYINYQRLDCHVCILVIRGEDSCTNLFVSITSYIFVLKEMPRSENVQD